MKIYEANIYDHETGRNEFVHLAVMEIETEQRYYDESEYDKLFQNSGYRDDDIFYYINQSEIPGKNNGHIMSGDVYDYITIRDARLVCQTYDISALRQEMVGNRYLHFKGDVYIVTDIARHTETEEIMVIYKNFSAPDLVWCRPIDMFLSSVDAEKYPEVKQKLRFERIRADERIESR